MTTRNLRLTPGVQWTRRTVDIVAHVLWTAAAGVGVRRRFKEPIHLGWAMAFAALPDLVPFTGPAIIRIARLLTGHASSLLPDGSGPRFDWVWDVYNATHSAVLFAIAFTAVWLFRNHPPLEMLGWALHIASDVFTHTGLFAVHFLWPLSTGHVDGIRWETPWLLAANYAALLCAWSVLLWRPIPPVAIESLPSRAILPLNRMRRGEYGYDAPYALIIFAGLALVSGIGAAISLWRPEIHAARPFIIYFILFLGNATSFFYTTRRGKFLEWERILDRLQLRGDETVLDMGCGRGAVLTAVARRLTTGKVTGVDIWSTTDQSGNAIEVTLRNASLEGVKDRVDIQTADMRNLPFPAPSFDLVVSSLAIHNISSNADRRKAISEAFRVLKPGGRIAIADIRATSVYADTLQKLGASNVQRHRLGWRFWWGNPIAATTLLTASKPSSGRF